MAVAIHLHHSNLEPQMYIPISELARKLNCEDDSLFLVFQKDGAPMKFQNGEVCIDEFFAFACLAKKGYLPSPTQTPMQGISYEQPPRIAPLSQARDGVIGPHGNDTNSRDPGKARRVGGNAESMDPKPRRSRRHRRDND
jgi:hypothetical protein